MTLDLATARTSIPRELDDFVTRFIVLSDEDLTRPTPCPEFDVRALASHLAGAALMMADGVERWAAGQTERPPAPERDPQTHDEIIAQLIEQRARIEKDLAAVTDDTLEGSVPYGFGVFPARFALALAVFEVGLHRWDLLTALGETHALPADVVDGMRAFATRYLRRPAKVAPDAPFACRLRADTYAIEVSLNDGVWQEGIEPSLPLCEIAGTDTDILVFVFGRISVTDGRLTVTGDAAAEAARFKTYFPGP